MRRLRGLYLPGPDHDFKQLVAFVRGLDFGQPGGLLAGFHEYLVLRLDDGDHLAWSSLVIRLAVDDAERFARPDAAPLTPSENQAAVEALFDALDEFLTECELSGAQQIHREYWLWRQHQPWFNLDLARFNASPAPETVSLDEAATRLGLKRAELLDLMVRQQVHPARVGPELLISEDDLASLESLPGAS